MLLWYTIFILLAFIIAVDVIYEVKWLAIHQSLVRRQPIIKIAVVGVSNLMPQGLWLSRKNSQCIKPQWWVYYS